jgi:4-amino-4-deoxy-L-arabinose transferase-like glycosyltransferase
VTGRQWTSIIYWALWIVAVTLYLAWPLTHLQAYAWSNDEGLYVQRAALANARYPLYTETFFNKPPLFVWILQAAFRLAAPTLAVARLTSLGLTLIGFITLGAIVRQLWGRWAGLAAASIFLALPEVPVRAHVVTSDLPALAFALAAMGTALAFRRHGRRAWVAISGAAFAATLAIHPMLICAGLPLLAILLLPRRYLPAEARQRTDWRDLAAFVGAGAGLGLIVLLAIDREAAFTWIFGYNVRTASAAPLATWGANWGQMIGYLRQRWPLVALATTSAILLAAEPRNRRGLAVLATWFLATATTLVVWSPVWVHYLLLLALPMVAASGGGLATLGTWIVAAWRGRRRLTPGRVALTGLMLTGVIAIAIDRSSETMPYLTGEPDWAEDRMAARELLQATVPPDRLVATDDPLLAFAADRLVAPPLTGASHKRINSGFLTTGEAVESVLRYRTPVVLFATGRLERLPGFEPWVSAVAAGRDDLGRLRAYHLDHPLAPSHSAESSLGNGIILRGYSISHDALQAGDTLTVTLFWERTGPVDDDYHVFVHLADAEERVWGQHDGQPLLGAHPTSQWAEDVVLPDPHSLQIDSQAPAGAYDLVVGMYRWPSLERLPAARLDGDRWPDDRIVLTPLTLSAQ